jgi:hypothetical protein
MGESTGMLYDKTKKFQPNNENRAILSGMALPRFFTPKQGSGWWVLYEAHMPG